MPARKRRRRRARKRATNPKKKHTRRRRKRRHNPTVVRAVASNPRRKRARRTRRHHAGGRRRKRRHNPMRATAFNPRRKRRRHHGGKRRHRRNPGIPVWAMAALGGTLGLVTYVIGQEVPFAITQRADPSMNTLFRNRYIAAGLLAAAGLGLTFVSPLLGVGVLAGAFTSALGMKGVLAISPLLDKDKSTTTTAGLGAIQPPMMGMGAIQTPMGQVLGPSMGDLAPPPPWQSNSPF